MAKTEATHAGALRAGAKKVATTQAATQVAKRALRTGRRGKARRRRGMVGTALRGAASGLVATAAMSAFLVGAQRAGLLGKQPPRLIVESVAPELPEGEARPTSVAAHFGYGAAGGAAYRVLSRVVPAGVASGATFGLAIWAASYEGWLPALGILPAAHRDRPGRRWTMIAAHLVYGAALGALTR